MIPPFFAQAMTLMFFAAPLLIVAAPILTGVYFLFFRDKNWKIISLILLAIAAMIFVSIFYVFTMPVASVLPGYEPPLIEQLLLFVFIPGTLLALLIYDVALLAYLAIRIFRKAPANASGKRQAKQS